MLARSRRRARRGVWSARSKRARRVEARLFADSSRLAREPARRPERMRHWLTFSSIRRGGLARASRRVVRLTRPPRGQSRARLGVVARGSGVRESPRRRRARLRGLAGASAPPPARVPSPGGFSIDRLCYRASSLLNPSRLLVAPRTRRLARRWTAAPPRAPPGRPRGRIPPTPPRARPRRRRRRSRPGPARTPRASSAAGTFERPNRARRAPR